MTGRITSSRDGAIGRIVIDDPQRRNAMGYDMYAAMPAAVAALQADVGLRVVVVRGAGDVAFGAGSNIAEFRGRRVGDAREDFDAVESAAVDALASLPVPVIASIHGACMGGGLGIALATDIRMAADDAQFAIPPARLGIGYPLDAMERLRSVVGTAAAKHLVLTAARIDADHALRIGLVHEVVPKRDLDDVVESMAQSISRLAPLTLHAAKAALDGRPDAEQATRACFYSADYLEGIAAFEDARQPIFKGQ